MPAIRLIDFFNQAERRHTWQNREGFESTPPLSEWEAWERAAYWKAADTIALVVSAGSLFVNAYRNQIAKTKAGRLFLEAWDVAEGIAEYYNWGRLGVDGLRLVHAKVGRRSKGGDRKSPPASPLPSGRRSQRPEQAEAWLGAVKETESTEARKYLEAHPPKKVEGEPGNRAC